MNGHLGVESRGSYAAGPDDAKDCIEGLRAQQGWQVSEAAESSIGIAEDQAEEFEAREGSVQAGERVSRLTG